MQTKIRSHNNEICNRYDGVKRNSASIYLHPVNEDEVMREISTLKNSCASGPDNIPSRIIKHCKEQLSKPLVHLINRIFLTGMFPIQLKASVVTPVYKSKAHQDINNYRPISIISNIAKIVEKCLKNRLLSFLHKHGILSKQQYVF